MRLKTILLSGVMATLCAGAAWAVPARQGLRVFTQPDGSKIELLLAGDEFLHSYLTPAGLTVGRGSDGYFYYLTPEGLTSMRVASGEDGPASVAVADRSEMTLAALAKSRKAEIEKRRQGRRGAVAAHSGIVDENERQVPCVGSPRIPVLLVEYQDKRFKDEDPNATFRSFFAEGETSAYQYFADQSNGAFTPQFDVYGPYLLSHNREYYGGNAGQDAGYDQRLGAMVAEGCQGLNAQVDFSRYDNNGDGDCDVVIVLFAGDGEASSYDEDAEDAIWPCQWSLSETPDYGKRLYADNTYVDKFAVFNELNGFDLSKIDGIGTFCHEFSHCIDLPDFYDTDYGPHFGMGSWSLLDYGCYNNDGYTPVGYTAYEKAFMGWIDIEEGESDTYYTLPVFNSKSIDSDKAIRLTNPSDPNEYYILENRAHQGWDAYLPAEGLMIYHVTYDANAWQKNVVNNYDMQRMTPVPADNILKMDTETYYGETNYYINIEDQEGDLWPYNGNDAFTDTSAPAATLNSGSRTLGKPVTNIVRNADGTISFWCDKAPLPAVDVPQNLRHSVIDAQRVAIYWDEVQNPEVTYTLEWWKHRDITYELISSTIFNNANHGWSKSSGFTEYDGNEKAMKLGSASQLGVETSPAFSGAAEENQITVRVNAKYYGSDESSLKVSLLSASGATLDSTTIPLTADFEDYAIVFNGQAGAQMKVALSTVAKKKRVYVKSVEIYSGDASELEAGSAKAGVSPRSVSFVMSELPQDGVILNDLEENAIYDCHVRAIPKDLTLYDPSDWSATMTIDMSKITGPVAVELVPTPTATPTRYYTLDGILLPGRPTAPGIYIEQQGSVRRKIRL